jgi:SAM-dependent methyltransferase
MPKNDPSPRANRDISKLPHDEYVAAMAERYATRTAPWDTGIPSAELIRTVEEGELPKGTLLEFGCGSGTNAVELARRGYAVTAVDLIEEPVGRGREKARHAGVNVRFLTGDLTRLDLGGPYDVVFDSGVYHGIRQRDLEGFLGALKRVTRPGTRWLSLAGNAKEPLPVGPPVVSEREFRAELEPLFRILRVREFRFDLAPDFQPLAWSILMERR